jgi:ribosomal protein S26
VYLCKVVCNELSELPVYSDYMTPLVPPKSSLRCILAAVYHRIMREVAKTLDLTAAGGAREARVSAAALNEALLDAGDSELSPIDL